MIFTCDTCENHCRIASTVTKLVFTVTHIYPACLTLIKLSKYAWQHYVIMHLDWLFAYMVPIPLSESILICHQYDPLKYSIENWSIFRSDVFINDNALQIIVCRVIAKLESEDMPPHGIIQWHKWEWLGTIQGIWSYLGFQILLYSFYLPMGSVLSLSI